MLPYRLQVTLDDHKLKGFVQGISRDLKEALKEVNQLAAKEVSLYIKEDLLSGGMLHDTSSQLRSETNSSLPVGALKRAVRVRSSVSADNRFSAAVFIQETGETAEHDGAPVSVKEVAKWLIEGRGPKGGAGAPWTIIPSEGNKALKFYRKDNSGPFYAKKIQHKGYKARDFMRKALRDKKQMVIDMISRRVDHVIRRWRKA